MSLLINNGLSPANLLEQIKLDFTRKKYTQVIVKALQVIKNNKANEWIIRLLILSYHQTKQWDFAEKYCCHLENTHPTFEHTNILFAETYQFSGQVRKAIPIWEEVIHSDNNVLWRFRLAQCHHQLKQTSISIGILEQLFKESEKLPEWLVIDALYLALKCNYTQLLDLHVAKIVSTHPQYFLLQAKACKIQSKWQEAASLYGSAYALNEKKEHWKLEQIRCLIKAGIPKDTWLPALQTLLESDTLSNTSLGTIGAILISQKEWQEVALLLKRMDTVHFKYYELSARLFMYQQEWAAAIAAWRKAQTLTENIPIWWHIKIISCHHQLGNKQEIAQLSSRLLANESLADNFLKQITHFLIQNDFFLLAQRAIDKISEANQEEAMVLSARLAIKQEAIEKALTLLKHLKTKHIVDEQLLKQIYTLELRIYTIQEDWVALKKHGVRFIQHFPNHWILYSRLLLAYIKLNKQKEYAELMEATYQRFQATTPQVNIMYSKFLELKGQKKKSLGLLEKAYEKDTRHLLPLLKRYIQDGNFSRFLKTATSDNLATRQKIEVYTELINAYIRIGHYQLLPSIIKLLQTIIPTNYSEVRLLAIAKMKIIQLYGILNTSAIDVSLLLNEQEKQHLKNYLETCLDTLEPREVLLNMIAEGGFISMTPTKT